MEVTIFIAGFVTKRAKLYAVTFARAFIMKVAFHVFVTYQFLTLLKSSFVPSVHEFKMQRTPKRAFHQCVM